MSKNSSTVRIIGGQHRGRRLRFLAAGENVRPSSDRLRETVFNWLQFELHGARVLDAFAGSGALGVEAVSRGAQYALFIEKSQRHCQQLKQAVAEVIGAEHDVICTDALTWLTHNTVQQPFHLVFVDPPYHLDLQTPFCQALVEHGWLADGALVYVESHSKSAAPQVPAHWRLHKEKTMGQIRAQVFIHHTAE